MRALVLRPFGHSPDGIRIDRLEAGVEADIRDDLAPGLLKAGYIGEPKPVEVAEESSDVTEEPVRRGPGRPRKG